MGKGQILGPTQSAVMVRTLIKPRQTLSSDFFNDDYDTIDMSRVRDH